MAEIKYNVQQVDPTTFGQIGTLQIEDQQLLSSYELNSVFDSEKHIIELHVYGLDGELLGSDYNYKDAKQLQNAQSAGRQGASILTLDPQQDAIKYGFTNGDVVLSYNFLNFLSKKDNIGTQFFIDQISNDRTELRVSTLDLTDRELQTVVDSIITRLNDSSDFIDFKLNFQDNLLPKSVNIKTELYQGRLTAVLKLYQPLDSRFGIKSTFTLQEDISNSVAFEITTGITELQSPVQFLKGPNFDIDIKDESFTPTEYFTLNDLFSFPVTNSYYELRSLFNEKGSYISVDHTDYSNFVHFSSAEERLRNFKYKLELINSYESFLQTTGSISYTKTGISGSREYYRNLITGIVDNFDHYDRFLYYESGSNAWPKSNTARPYTNYPSTHISSSNWFTLQLASASLFDNNNDDRLTHTIPSFLKDDPNNAPYLAFVDMVGQHFDNIWIYTKAVSDKYDGDNRLDRGISRDLVKDALTSFGVNIKESNQGLSNLFSIFTGETYSTGSENITTVKTITSGSSNSYLQPMPEDFYTKEVYKRIYHNIPLLLKSKGTERGIKALINCFGIPTNLLKVRYFGGANENVTPYLGPFTSVTSSLDKIRLDNTGSTSAGNTLSQYASIVQRDNKFTEDIHTLEIGFSTDEPINEFIRASVPSSFDIDDYIGDPRHAYTSSYVDLELQADTFLSSSVTDYNAYNLVRLVKFFDNRIFRTIKDFVPARSNVNTGVVIKPHVLNRSKIKQVQGSFSNEMNYSGSIEMVGISGSFAGAYPKGIDPTGSLEYTTSHSLQVMTQYGTVEKDITDESPKYNGELSGSYIQLSNREVNINNVFKYFSPGTASYKISLQSFSESPTPTPTPAPTATPEPTATPTLTPTPTVACISTSLGYDDTLPSDACDDYAFAPGSYGTDTGNLLTATILYSTTSCAANAAAGYYSNGVKYRYWDGSTFTSEAFCPV